MKKIFTIFIFVATLILAVSSAQAGTGDKIGIVMVDHSGPEYYPADPGGGQCVACDEGQPYTDAYDHSADGYFKAINYNLYYKTQEITRMSHKGHGTLIRRRK